MKKILLAVTAVVCGSGPRHGTVSKEPTQTANDCGVVDTTSLTGNGYGDLRIGAPAANVRRTCHVVRDTILLGEEALPQRVITVRTARGVVDAEVDSGRVFRIVVRQRVPRVAGSLGVGSELGELLAASRARGGEGEGGLFVVLDAYCGLSFRLAYAPADHRPDWTDDNLRELPRHTTVDEVLAVGCPK